jgi:hypothetical protein
MVNKTGMAVYRGGKLHFDATGWAMIKAVAKKKKQSPAKVVNGALARYIRSQRGKKS